MRLGKPLARPCSCDEGEERSLAVRAAVTNIAWRRERRVYGKSRRHSLSPEGRMMVEGELAHFYDGSLVGYTRQPGWHTETALGQNLITAFNLDPDYCAGEDLTFLVSEALAALSMAVSAAVKAIGEAVGESENPEDHEEAEEALQALFNFAVWSFLGTQMVMAPGTSLKDFLPRNRS